MPSATPSAVHDRVEAFPVAQPVSASEQRAAAESILALGRQFRRAEITSRHGNVWALRATLVAPARAVREALEGVRSYGRTTAEHSRIPRTRQAIWLWWLNLRHQYRSTEAYRYRLFSWSRVLPRPGFIQWSEAALLYRTIIPQFALRSAEILADKRRFGAWCAENGIASPKILAQFENGRSSGGRLDPADAAGTDLFAKWGTQYGGGDTQRWQWSDGGWRDDDGGTWSLEEIMESLAERSRDGVVLLQPRLVNHPALRPLSPNALSTLRIMTTQHPGEKPRFLAGLLRMGTGRATADNFAQGGIAGPVDHESGIAGVARSIDAQHRTSIHRTHPDTGAAIEGFRVPFWEESVELALRAHQLLGPIPCVGWDVAVLDDGPVLLEGNWNPCTKLLQVATQTPLLGTEFARAYAAWLRVPGCRTDDRWLLDQAEWSPV